jgi:hypothetical protein
MERHNLCSSKCYSCKQFTYYLPDVLSASMEKAKPKMEMPILLAFEDGGIFARSQILAIN